MKIFKKVIRLLIEEVCSLSLLIKYKLTGEKYIRVKYFKAVKNWGDILNVYLIENVTGMKVLHHPLGYKPHLLGIGSVIASANSKSVIWGSGLMYEKQTPKSIPLSIHSVRGPKTKDRLESLGINVPEVYGDPCVILKKYFNPKNIEKKYKLGVIPHYVDKDNENLDVLLSHEDVKFIDIQQEIEPFLVELLECENIASSSLHGMIASDTYNIPNCRLIFGDGVVGGSFKFDDYHLGIGVSEYNVIDMNIADVSDIDGIISKCTLKNIPYEVVEKIATAAGDIELITKAK